MINKQEIKKHEINQQDRLLDYLRGIPNNEKDHAFEKQMLNDPFTADALEGLYGQMSNVQIEETQKKLNSFINQRIKNKKHRKNQLLSFPIWIMLLSAILLLISIAGFIIIKLLKD